MEGLGSHKRSSTQLRRIHFWDGFARLGVIGGGILIILAVLGISLQIGWVAIPLFFQGEAYPGAVWPDGLPSPRPNAPPSPRPNAPPTAPPTEAQAPTGTAVEASAEVVWIGLGTYRQRAYQLDAAGWYRFQRLDPQAEPLTPVRLAPPAPSATRIERAQGDSRLHAVRWNDGRITLQEVSHTPRFDTEGKRRIEAQPRRWAIFPPPPNPSGEAAEEVPAASSRAIPREFGGALYRDDDLQRATVAVQVGARQVWLSRQRETETLFGERSRQRQSELLTLPSAETITTLTLSADGQMLYAGTAAGRVWLWRWEDDQPPTHQATLTSQNEASQNEASKDEAGDAVTSLVPLLGDRSFAWGTASGELRIWSPVPQIDAQGVEERRWREIHRLPRQAGGIRRLVASANSKLLFSLDARGLLRVLYPTTERVLLELTFASLPSLWALNLRSDGLVAQTSASPESVSDGSLSDGSLRFWRLNIPHPEGGWAAYFKRLWYEEFARPSYIWQSSASSVETEAKLSLVPLIVGTLKGTLYSMLLAAPLAVLAAIYTSQLMHARLRRVIKPAFEIMEAVPTVVLGFMAAFWLAPILSEHFSAFLAALILFPAAVFVGSVLFERLPLPLRWRNRFLGREFMLLIPLLLGGAALAYLSGKGIEHLFFEGNFLQWLYREWGVSYSQRNALVIALALGMAVIPTVFTLSEDALSNVPRSLTAASLALGASRWQTVWRVLLPSALPGVFAALMVGLGRAVGETMIVLMATGNTPIIDLSPLSGMRTLSANIAVEIPEAPQGGTLYRVLFLSGMLLFIFTFFINSLAELVRRRLRRRY